MSKATFFQQAFNGIEVGSHIPQDYCGDALYEGIKEWSKMGQDAQNAYRLSYIESFGPVDFIKAAIFPAPCQDIIKPFYANQRG
jgi:hypothetical protein